MSYTHKELDEILLNDELAPEVKVYKIAKILHNNHMLTPQLWYAILDLKDKHFFEFPWDSVSEEEIHDFKEIILKSPKGVSL